MKSFEHFYKDIVIEGITPVGKPSHMIQPADFNIFAPKGWPRKIVLWLSFRKIKREFGATNLTTPSQN